MSNKKVLAGICLMILTSNVYSVERHDVIVSLQSKNNYGVKGKNITIETVECNEFANDTLAVLWVNTINNAQLTFANGTNCAVSNIRNWGTQSLDESNK